MREAIVREKYWRTMWGTVLVDLKIRFNLKMCGGELKRNEIVIKSKWINKKDKVD